MNAITNEFLLTEQERAQVENRDLARLQKTLGYTFKDESLLQEALCHSSFANEHGMHKSNERLEFLGDSVLSYVVARALFKEYPNAAEGELTRMRSELVRESSLYSRALILRVPELLLHGRSMQSPALPKSICADAVEAILGAICLDGGIEAVSGVVERLFLRESREIQAGRPALDPKSHLQALLQARGIPLPAYELLAVKGPSHMPVFHVRLRVNGIECVATGSTRKGAESAVATEMMRALAFPKTAVTKSEVAKIQSENPVNPVTSVSSSLSATSGEILSPEANVSNTSFTPASAMSVFPSTATSITATVPPTSVTPASTTSANLTLEQTPVPVTVSPVPLVPEQPSSVVPSVAAMPTPSPVVPVTSSPNVIAAPVAANLMDVSQATATATAMPAPDTVPVSSVPSTYALPLDASSQIFQDEYEPPQPSPEELRYDLSKYASTLVQNPALRALSTQKRSKPDSPVSEPENVSPHPVLTESDLRRIVQMAHRGGE